MRKQCNNALSSILMTRQKKVFMPTYMFLLDPLLYCSLKLERGINA